MFKLSRGDIPMGDSKRGIFKLLAAAVAAALLGLVGYEAISVALARVATPEIFAPYEAATDNGATPPAGLSSERIETLLKVQDPSFWTHGGVDWSAPLATTVTQSVVKRLYFDDFEPGFAKIRQTLIAQFAVGPLTSKNAQLAAFIDVNGFDAASRKWFGKPLAELDDEEFLSLVASNNNPNDYAPGTQANGERMRRIERYLAGLCQRQGFADVWLEGCKD
jgi:monofunctional biosynthetic peptidoglycan transglycosylase